MNAETAEQLHAPASPAAQMVSELRARFDSGATRPIEWRLQQIQRIIDLIDDKEDEWMQALYEDSGKSEFNCYAGDLLFVRAEALHALKKLKKWMKPQKVGTPIHIHPARSYIRHEPLGVVLIIGAWNFPVQLTLGPLVGALAAGNTALIKPSEVSPRVSALLAKYIPDYFDGSAVKVIEGGVEETTDALAQRYDKVFYTGNSAVAKIVMAAAAKHLTPVTLELGGKNPTIVTAKANLEVAARRIVEGKWANNAGQVCVSADHLYIERSIYDEFLVKLKEKIVEFFGTDASASKDYSTIINGRHVERLKAMLDGGGDVYFGGDVKPEQNYIGPTIMTNVPADAAVMQDEIFGPLLPVFTYDNIDAVIAEINSREKPLAMYIFSEDRRQASAILDRTNSGGVSINAIMMQAGNDSLPFGGVGHSGMGSYHGKHSFVNMSHQRAVVDKSTRVDPKGAYPPFSDEDMATRKKITRWLLSR